jgi:hypothetical protein
VRFNHTNANHRKTKKMKIETLKARIANLTTNELIDALHAHGLAPAKKYGAANAIAADRKKCERDLLTILKPLTCAE